nr:hypothetical protein [Tanacetum cinerariifolium]
CLLLGITFREDKNARESVWSDKVEQVIRFKGLEGESCNVGPYGYNILKVTETPPEGYMCLLLGITFREDKNARESVWSDKVEQVIRFKGLEGE